MVTHSASLMDLTALKPQDFTMELPVPTFVQTH